MSTKYFNNQKFSIFSTIIPIERIQEVLAYIGLGLSAVVGLDKLVSIDIAVLCPSDLVLLVRGADVGLRPMGTGEVGRAPTSLAEGPILLTRLCREPMLSLCLS